MMPLRIHKSLKNPSIVLIVSAILLITFISFLPSLFNDFVSYDDQGYITANPRVINFSLQNVKQIFFDQSFGQYFPLTLLSYNLNYLFFGQDPFSYHLINLLLHLFNAILVFYFFYLLTEKQVILSFLTTILFAIHPLRVESVAWAAERKDVLFAFFYLASLIAYVRYTEKRQWRLYWLSLALFLLSLFSKTMAVGLPLALFTVDYLLNRRLNMNTSIEKIPFVILSALFCGIIYLIHNQFQGTVSNFSLIFGSIQFYLSKIIYPVNLCLFYASDFKRGTWDYYFYNASPFIFLVLTVGALLLQKSSKKIVFAWLFYLATMVPAMFCLQWNDRFTYIPSLGPSFLFANAWLWLYKKGFNKLPLLKIILWGLLIIIMATFSLLSWNRCKIWKDDKSLWNDVKKKAPTFDLPDYYLGLHYLSLKDYGKATTSFDRALELNPENSLAYSALGTVYMDRGLYNQALDYLDNALNLNPYNLDARFNHAVCYMRSQRWVEAIDDLNKVVNQQQHTSYLAYSVRGSIYLRLGELDKALSDYNEAIQLNPQYARAYFLRGQVLLQKGELDRSQADFNKAIILEPNSGEYYFYRATVYSQMKDFENFRKNIEIAHKLGFFVDQDFKGYSDGGQQ